ncbi:penicillin-binding protein 2 [Filomicrobium sp.]|uniref:peptidoglycan D,D-transpeptidase FtsI family protein n=1 Tax=Filomicrobium sp. TaxID=2024831 RepID=UPI0025861BB9|nr:penicillin-binding protein 2 [Filomicrobium sp.]MCV0369049.1 penicillin-binding protein 2 [Filomicrobium sp.]
MTSGIIITPGLPDRALAANAKRERVSEAYLVRIRAVAAIAGVMLAFALVAGQLVRLAILGQGEVSVSMSQPMAIAFARPDIVDRNGQLLASDLIMPSLFADPALVVDKDELAEKLGHVLPGLNQAELRKSLADRDKRFVWIRRGTSTRQAEAIHNLGLPGIEFRNELKRAYPSGTLAGHVLGYVDIDNKGIAGIERFLDENGQVDPVHTPNLSNRPPVQLSLDIGVQHAVEEELAAAMATYEARAAVGLVMDAKSGEILAAASLPGVDPLVPSLERETMDRLSGGTFELGSIFKMFTVAMAMDSGKYTLDTPVDVRKPLSVGGFTITDSHPIGRILSVAEVFRRSSNVGAGMLALDLGAGRQKEFFQRIGLTGAMKTEAGSVADVQLPERWEAVETVTRSYGHGIAVTPLQFAAAAASLVNGGKRIQPTYLRRPTGSESDGERVISEETSRKFNVLMRSNVTERDGTGRRANVPGLEVGGKTGTAELPGKGGYKEKSVISSFFAAFPMSNPKYVTLVSLFEPQPIKETSMQITAGRNAAPVTAKIIARIAPQLDVTSRSETP